MKVEKSYKGPPQGASSRDLLKGPPQGASSRGLLKGPPQGASSRDLLKGPPQGGYISLSQTPTLSQPFFAHGDTKVVVVGALTRVCLYDAWLGL